MPDPVIKPLNENAILDPQNMNPSPSLPSSPHLRRQLVHSNNHHLLKSTYFRDAERASLPVEPPPCSVMMAATTAPPPPNRRLEELSRVKLKIRSLRSRRRRRRPKSDPELPPAERTSLISSVKQTFRSDRQQLQRGERTLEMEPELDLIDFGRDDDNDNDNDGGDEGGKTDVEAISIPKAPLAISSGMGNNNDENSIESKTATSKRKFVPRAVSSISDTTSVLDDPIMTTVREPSLKSDEMFTDKVVRLGDNPASQLGAANRTHAETAETNDLVQTSAGISQNTFDNPDEENQIQSSNDVDGSHSPTAPNNMSTKERRRKREDVGESSGIAEPTVAENSDKQVRSTKVAVIKKIVPSNQLPGAFAVANNSGDVSRNKILAKGGVQNKSSNAGGGIPKVGAIPVANKTMDKFMSRRTRRKLSDGLEADQLPGPFAISNRSDDDGLANDSVTDTVTANIRRRQGSDGLDYLVVPDGRNRWNSTKENSKSLALAEGDTPSNKVSPQDGFDKLHSYVVQPNFLNSSTNSLDEKHENLSEPSPIVTSRKKMGQRDENLSEPSPMQVSRKGLGHRESEKQSSPSLLQASRKGLGQRYANFSERMKSGSSVSSKRRMRRSDFRQHFQKATVPGAVPVSNSGENNNENWIQQKSGGRNWKDDRANSDGVMIENLRDNETSIRALKRKNRRGWTATGLSDSDDSASLGALNSSQDKSSEKLDVMDAAVFPASYLEHMDQTNADVNDVTKQRNLYMRASVCCILLVALVVGIPLGVISRRKEMELALTTLPPSSFVLQSDSWEEAVDICQSDRSADLFSRLAIQEQESYSVYLSELGSFGIDLASMEPCSPQQQALVSMAVLNRSTALRNRFILSSFFFSAFGLTWRDNTGWIFANDVCTWSGVVCSSNGEITELSLDKSINGGSIVDELFLLTSLRILSLEDSSLKGTIPPNIGDLSNLEVLNLFGTGIESPIPAEIGGLTSLRELMIGSSLVENSLLPIVGSLTPLQILKLDVPFDQGEIPDGIGDSFVNLEVLYLSGNFEGDIPENIFTLPKAKSLTILNTLLTGKLYEDIFLDKTDWEHIEIRNTFIEGTIPTDIGRATELRHFEFAASNLRGTVPTEIGQCISLENLILSSSDDMTGSIPSSLLSLSDNLRTLRLGGIPLTPPIPQEVGNFTKLRELEFGWPQYLEVEHQFVDVMPDGVCEKQDLKVVVPCRSSLFDSCPLGCCDNCYTWEP